MNEPDDINLTSHEMLEIAALGGNGSEYVDFTALIDQSVNEYRVALERIRQLEEALRPFAEEADNLGDIEKDDQEYLGVILCGEIRAARRALGESK